MKNYVKDYCNTKKEIIEFELNKNCVTGIFHACRQLQCLGEWIVDGYYSNNCFTIQDLREVREFEWSLIDMIIDKACQLDADTRSLIYEIEDLRREQGE